MLALLIANADFYWIYHARVTYALSIAAPVTWKQVERGIEPDAFMMGRPGMQERATDVLHRQSTRVQRLG
jgi:DNA primase